MTKHYLDLHILQSLPPSNVNRDDTGRPKTAEFGGSLRARVSSQSWKRAVRKAFDDLIDPSEHAVRTLRVVEELTPRLQELRPDWSKADCEKRITEVFAAVGIKLEKPKKTKDDHELPARSQYLLFLSNYQLDNIAELAAGDGKLDRKAVKEAAQSNHGIALSLFGRMMADATDLNVDSAVQVAHALSTHAVDRDADYYTAVDDVKHEGDDAGAGMIGYIDFNSSTLYRFATIDLDQLRKSIGSVEMTSTAVRAFVEGFALSMPSGKQNTFGNNSLPAAVLVQLRQGRSASYVNAFEDAIPPSEHGYLKPSAERLAQHAQDLEAAFIGAPAVSLLTRVNDDMAALDALATPVPFPELLERVVEAVGDTLGQQS